MRSPPHLSIEHAHLGGTECASFRKLGGAVKIIVPDNLGEGVLKPNIYDATLNPLYRDVLAHYGAVHALPCR